MSDQLDRIESMLERLTVSQWDQVNTRWVQLQAVEMLEAMAQGRKVDAIKACRAITGRALKEAKDLICNVMP